MEAVALFTRAWIEIPVASVVQDDTGVALFTRAWIEIFKQPLRKYRRKVALFTRAWIEITLCEKGLGVRWSPSSRGRGLKSQWEVNGDA